MAFRKRKKIAKGLHLNLSGSGAGLGYRLFPGLSFSLNRNGVYCNTSIPGSGFYSRNKITGSSSINQGSYSYDSLSSPSYQSREKAEVEIHIHAENDGNYTTHIYDADGKENTNPIVEYNVLHNRAYKEAVVKAINDCTNELTEMYKLTARPLTTIDMEKKVEESKPISPKEAAKKLEKVKPIDIVPDTYNVDMPTYESIREMLVAEAEEKISSIFFWTNSRKREAYVSQMIEHKYKEELVKWESAKKDFEQQQAEFVKAEKSRMQKAYDEVLKEIETAQLEYEDAQKALDGFVNGDENYINESIDHLLACLKVPFEFSINYEYLPAHNILRIQLDLPEIEDFPKKKASLLATEEISIKDKGKAECTKDYATSVCGMAFFFAGMMFNVSLKIRDIDISAYTQRINKATGNEEDSYIYSVVFNRSQFARINYDAIDPIEALKAQANKSKILKSFEMREIVPFSEEEVIKIASCTDVFSSKPKDVLVQNEKELIPKVDDDFQIENFSIAGINYRQGIKNYIGTFEGRLLPEPTNEYDPNAIRVEHSDGHHLGYIPSDDTNYLRNLVDNRFPVSCSGEIIEKEDLEDNRKYFQGFVYVEIPEK